MRRLFLVLLLLACSPPERPRTAPDIPDIALEQVAEGLDHPLFLTETGLVAQQRGQVLDLKTREVRLDLSDRVRYGGECGLLGLAERDGKLYVNYTTRVNGKLETRVSSFQEGKESVLLAFGQPYSNHNGGMIAFGPDGMLYVAVGDGGSANDPHNNAQNLGNLLGKILRIDVRKPPYAIPADNPFVNREAARGEIWAYGLRNPWRFSFDRKTGWLFAGDVGQRAREEVDIVIKGGNYGWRVMEGFAPNSHVEASPVPDAIRPILDYPRSEGQCITGGYVYRGKRHPALDGVYIYGDYLSGRVWGLRTDGQKLKSHRELLKTSYRIASFAEDAEGELYLLDLKGAIYRITAAPTARSRARGSAL